MTNQTSNEVLEILANRGHTYALLSQMVRQEPTVPFLKELVNDLVSLEEPDEAAGEGLALLRQFALEVVDIRQTQSELTIEYSRLFLVGRNGGVHPFESVYTSARGLMMQEARDEVRAAYRKEGLAKAEEFNEPDDHLAVELDFMAGLCQKTAGAIGSGQGQSALSLLDAQRSFLNDHLLKWVPRFCQDLAEAARSDFYRGAALLLDEHLAQEGAILAELYQVLQ